MFCNINTLVDRCNIHLSTQIIVCRWITFELHPHKYLLKCICVVYQCMCNYECVSDCWWVLARLNTNLEYECGQTSEPTNTELNMWENVSVCRCVGVWLCAWVWSSVTGFRFSVSSFQFPVCGFAVLSSHEMNRLNSNANSQTNDRHFIVSHLVRALKRHLLH